MGKLISILVLMGTIALVFNMFGLVGVGEPGGLVYLIVHINDFTFSDFFQDFQGTSASVLAVVGISIAGIASSLFGRLDLAIGILMIGFFVSFGADFWVIINSLIQINYFLGMIIGAPLLLLYFLSIMEWVRMKD